MSLGLMYGKENLQSSFLAAVEGIANDVLGQNYSAVRKKVNDAFFEGGPFAPKSPKQIYSKEIPEIDLEGLSQTPSKVTIQKRYTFNPILDTLQGILLIGSVFAVINSFSHLYGMVKSSSSLKESVNVYRKISQQNTQNPLHDAVRFAFSRTVFEKAVAYTVHKNQLYLSLLSIIPGAISITRLAQAIIYKSNTNAQ
jgi:hypothetical protein